MGQRSERGTWFALAAVGAAAVSAAVVAAVGTIYARLIVTPDRRTPEPVTVTEVESIDSETVVWMRGTGVTLPGQYSLLFDGDTGHARVGRIRASRGREVARPVLAVDRGQLRPGALGRINGWWYTDPEELSNRVERITYPTELGDAEAWIIRPRWPRKHRWAIHVHGRGSRPEETLRGVAPLLRAGITCLVITYRNDDGAPRSAHGRYGMGVSEAHDVDSAIEEALRRDAQRVTLFGWSMGGTASLLCATMGRHTAVIDGVILDSPAIDWREVLMHQGQLKKLPSAISNLSINLLSNGRVRTGSAAGISMDQLSPAGFAQHLAVPVHIQASTGDTLVPSRGARRLAELRPDLVDLRMTDAAEHVRIWNVDPEQWEEAIYHFAATLPAPPWRG